MFISISLLLTACTVAPVVVDVTEQYQVPDKLSAGKGWWYARFRVTWPEGEKPDWSIGTLVAGEIIAPVINKYRQDIELWRFHRRAARDGYDHVFSFIFYSSAETASLIYQNIDRNEQLQQLKSEQVIIWTGFDNTTTNKRPEVSATSDSSWPEEIQQTWPVFIMGASQMWLDLVKHYSRQSDADMEPVQRYQIIQQKVTEVWQDNGRHAWLHHLNGLYAYQPMLMRY
jgi:hypothetical protein